MLVVERAEPEDVKIKTTRSDRSRRVPIADRVLPLIRACAEGRGPDERLFVTESGHRLHSSGPGVGRDLARPTDS
jgi:integrase